MKKHTSAGINMTIIISLQGKDRQAAMANYATKPCIPCQTLLKDKIHMTQIKDDS